jgi:hypothetical protein
MATLTTLPKRAVKQGLVIHKIAERSRDYMQYGPFVSPTCVALPNLVLIDQGAPRRSALAVVRCSLRCASVLAGARRWLWSGARFAALRSSPHHWQPAVHPGRCHAMEHSRARTILGRADLKTGWPSKPTTHIAWAGASVGGKYTSYG